MNLDFGSNHQLVYRSEGLSLQTSVTGSPVTWSGSSAVLVSDGFCTDALTAPENPSGQVLDFDISERTCLKSCSGLCKPTVPPSAR